MKILITGNQGYIGTKLTEYFLENTNYNIFGLDTGYFKTCITNDNFKKSKFRQVYKDVRNINKNDLKGIDTIIHLASISNDPIGNEFKKITNEINLQASKKISCCSANFCISFVSTHNQPSRQEQGLLTPCMCFSLASITVNYWYTPLEFAKECATLASKSWGDQI